MDALGRRRAYFDGLPRAAPAGRSARARGRRSRQTV